jgi:type I restriction enzyme, S subunit
MPGYLCPPGYKQTEVGVIPEKWEVKPLGTILKKGRLGGNYPNQDREAEHPLMKMGNLARGYIDTSKVEYITPGVTPELQHKLAYGDVLFNTRNTLDLVGKVAIWRDELPTAYYNSNLMRLEFDPQQVGSTEYANYFLNTTASVGSLRALATGTTSVAAIYTRDLLKLPFVMPPVPEQRVIARALSDVDALLGTLDQLIDKKRDLKQATMQQLLTGQTRLPSFHGEWELKRLGEIADVKTGPFGSSLHESDYVRDGTPIITVEHLGEFGVTHFNLPFVSDSDRRRLLAYSLEIGDIVFSRVGSVDRNALIRPDEEGWLFSGRLLRVRPDRQKAFAPFLSCQFHGERFKGLVRNVAVGQTMACLNTQILKGIAVVLPSLREQAAIAEVLSDMDVELAALEQRRDKTRALKQGMMQELLTGRTRLV